MRFEGDSLRSKSGLTVRVDAANAAARDRVSSMLCYTVGERRLLADSCPMRQTQRNQKHGFAYDRAAGQSNA